MGNTVKKNMEQSNSLRNKFNTFFKKVDLSNTLKKASIVKYEGVSAMKIFKIILLLIFTGKNWYQQINDDQKSFDFSKDVIYRFLKCLRFNWELLLLETAMKLIERIACLTKKTREKVLIVDDSYYDRNRSKKVELLARVYDHITNKYVKGYRMLVVAWSDGNTVVPLTSQLLSSANEKNILFPEKAIRKRYIHAIARRQNARKDSISMLLESIEKIKELRLSFKYLLMDSWFAFPKTITKLMQLNVPVIAMLKRMRNVFYEYQKKKLNLISLYSKTKSKLKKGRLKYSVLVKLYDSELNKTIPAKIVFVFEKNKRKEWIAVITTDIELPDDEVIRIYGKRWGIEVCFKIIKSYLGLAKEFSGRSFDMLTAHTVIVFFRYFMLALESRENKDDRTMGDLFYFHCDELEDISFHEALLMILDFLKMMLKKYFSISGKKIQNFTDDFLKSLPEIFKLGKFKLCET